MCLTLYHFQNKKHMEYLLHFMYYFGQSATEKIIEAAGSSASLSSCDLKIRFFSKLISVEVMPVQH